MDLGIKEIFTTLLIGAFTILGLELILFELFRIRLTGFFAGAEGFLRRKEDVHESIHMMKLGVFIGLAFGIGILAEDLSYKFVDNEMPFGLPSKYDSRITSLIGSIEAPEVNPLAKELARNGAFEVIISDKSTDGYETRKWMLSGDKVKTNPCVVGNPHCHLTSSILGLYYYAKNVVYSEPNYYDEMKKIQNRADFTRSIAVIGFVYILATIAGVVVLASIWGYMKLSKTKPKEKSSYGKRFDDVEVGRDFTISLKKLGRAGVIVAVLFATMVFAAWAYNNEASEFNKRAFGYFNSMLTREKILRQKVEDKRTLLEIDGSLNLTEGKKPASTLFRKPW